MDFLKCQTLAASPAEPGGLPPWARLPVSGLLSNPRFQPTIRMSLTTSQVVSPDNARF